jgi:hypothetical protein
VDARQTSGTVIDIFLRQPDFLHMVTGLLRSPHEFITKGIGVAIFSGGLAEITSIFLPGALFLAACAFDGRTVEAIPAIKGAAAMATPALRKSRRSWETAVRMLHLCLFSTSMSDLPNIVDLIFCYSVP